MGLVEACVLVALGMVLALAGRPIDRMTERARLVAVGLSRAFYAGNGAEFIELPNRSQYPRRQFFDTPLHLRQEAQAAHSELIAGALRPFID